MWRWEMRRCAAPFPASDATIPVIAGAARSTSTAALRPIASGSASRRTLKAFHGRSVESPEEYLTEERLKTMTIDRLCYWKEFDRAAEAVEKMGFWLVGPDIWENLALRLAFYGCCNAFQRVLEVRRKAGVTDTTLDMMYQLAPIQDDPVKSWDWLDDEALSVIRSGDPDDLRQLALALLLTKHQPLGILLARGVIPLVSPDAASSLIDWVMEARRQLTLDADDPINEIADMVSTARREASETDAALRETRELLELKAREAREAKESRDQALREVKRREEEMARKREAEAAMATPEEVAALKEWRRKAEKYEQEIRERNTENPEFRRKPALNLNDKLPFLHRRSS